AGENFSPDIPLSYIKQLLGKKRRTSNDAVLPERERHTIPDSSVPQQFDSRKHWPYCPSIKHIRDQGVCGSCWAVAAASTLSDRFCIASKGIIKKPLSIEELLSCCEDCGEGCNGGEDDRAWKFFETHGIVTGGDYHSKIGCQPYQIQPCEHHTTGKRPACSTLPSTKTPDCQKKCINTNYKKPFENDHYKTKVSYTIAKDVMEIKKEILLNGPVEGGFIVYEDFPVYKSGVYQHTTGKELGGHAIRIIGWGIENGTSYWLIANSWNTDWGDNGVFKMLQGVNECGIEEEITAGEPDV
ncbi:hypothetical protein AAG570_006503, partial [Ranatra chinensis]